MKFLKAEAQFVAFAPIDLKQAEIYLRDGFDNGTNTPLTTDIEPIGETTIALTAMNGVVPPDATVKFGSDEQEYGVVSRNLGSATDEVQTLTVTGTPTGGGSVISFGGDSTAEIPYDSTAAEVELYLEAMDSIPQGEATCAGGPWPGSAITVTFTGSLEGDVALMTNVDNFSGGSSPELTITETTPGVLGTTTTDMVISPALKVATTSAGSVIFNGRVLEVKIGEGAFNYSESQPRDYILDRGNLDLVRDGDDEPMEVSFDFVWEFLTSVSGSNVPTIRDVLYNENEASDWVTTSDDPCEPYCVDIEVHYDPDCGGDNSELIICPYFRHEKLEHNLRDSQVACTGKCNAKKATISRGS